MGIFNFAQGGIRPSRRLRRLLAYSHGLPISTGMTATPFRSARSASYSRRSSSAASTPHPSSPCSATYALGLIIRESVRGLIGGFYLTVPEPIGGSIDIGTMHISAWRFTIIVITLLVMGGCFTAVTHQFWSPYARHAGEPLAGACVGHLHTPDVRPTFAFGSALAGLAGALIVPVFSLFADLGIRFLIQGFVAVMVGGVGSFIGPVAGAASSERSVRRCPGSWHLWSPTSSFSFSPSSSSNSGRRASSLAKGFITCSSS